MLELEISPSEVAERVLLTAFKQGARQQRHCLRALRRVLNLAVERGYRKADELVRVLSSQSVVDAKILGRRLKQLFEYVSPEEFSQLVVLRGF